MSDAIFVRSDTAVPELAATLAVALSGRVSHEPDGSTVRFDAAALAGDPSGGGQPSGVARLVVLRPDPYWPFYLPGEFLATDAYDIELRLRPPDSTSGGSYHPAARQLFQRVCAELDAPALHVTDLDRLTAAYRPGHGSHEFPEGVTIEAPDAARWGDWVLASPATRRHQDTGGTIEEARDLLVAALRALAREVYPNAEPVVEAGEGPVPGDDGPVRWVVRVATGSPRPPWDAGRALADAAAALDAQGWWVAHEPRWSAGRWTVTATREGHRLTATMSEHEGILRLRAETPWYPPPDAIGEPAQPDGGGEPAPPDGGGRTPRGPAATVG
jgi:hypothetical protein